MAMNVKKTIETFTSFDWKHRKDGSFLYKVFPLLLFISGVIILTNGLINGCSWGYRPIYRGYNPLFLSSRAPPFRLFKDACFWGVSCFVFGGVTSLKLT